MQYLFGWERKGTKVSRVVFQILLPMFYSLNVVEGEYTHLYF